MIESLQKISYLSITLPYALKIGLLNVIMFGSTEATITPHSTHTKKKKEIGI
jgi:hypothetical protein